MSLPKRPGFHRRHYRHPGEFWGDLRQLRSLRSPVKLHQTMIERLMLVVTSVNRCRYCASFHTEVARLSGLSTEEITLLLEGSTQGAPPAEIPALLFARHWAEAGGTAGPELRAELIAHYGTGQALAIERTLRTIWIGNLLGNSWDALLFWLSGGRLGQGHMA
ncbi:MAG: carboxymuconolactone decarboxylase family protein [Oscillochloridaceae bacterium umkhey_bin13]